MLSTVYTYVKGIHGNVLCCKIALCNIGKIILHESKNSVITTEVGSAQPSGHTTASVWSPGLGGDSLCTMTTVCVIAVRALRPSSQFWNH